MGEKDYCRWASSCERKVRFSRSSHARLRIWRILRWGSGHAVERLVPYRCQYCGGFHIGHAASCNRKEIKKGRGNYEFTV